MSKKVKALRLTLGNAPNTWHVVEGLPGFYHPLIPTLVEDWVDAADAAHKSPGCGVEYTEVSADEVEKLREAQDEARRAAARGLATQRGVAEAAKVQTETAALSGKE